MRWILNRKAIQRQPNPVHNLYFIVSLDSAFGLMMTYFHSDFVDSEMPDESYLVFPRGGRNHVPDIHRG